MNHAVTKSALFLLAGAMALRLGGTRMERLAGVGRTMPVAAFAFVIAAVGCYEGLQVKGSADSVGRQTTKSVVEAIFFVVVLDALFSIIFLVAGV